jgi:hypothetical protein
MLTSILYPWPTFDIGAPKVSLQHAMLAYFLLNGATTNSFKAAEFEFLSLFVAVGTRNEMWIAYLRAQGATATTLNDLWKSYLALQGYTLGSVADNKHTFFNAQIA